MRSATRWLTATAITAVMVAAAAVPASADTPQTTVALPLTGYSAVAVDPALGHVFVSSARDHAVVVTDLSGNVVKKLDNMEGASGLALSPDGDTMYVALSQFGSVSAIDTLTLTERARIPVGEVCPQQLAFAGTTLYFAYNCSDQWGGAIGSAVITGSTAVVQHDLSTGYYGAPLLATSPARPNLLAVGQTGLSPATISVLRIEGETLVQQASIREGSNLRDVEFSRDGSLLHVASGAPYVIQSFTSDSLAVRASYQTGPYPIAASVSPDTGALAGGIDASSGDNGVFIYPHGSYTASRRYVVNDLAPSGLVWGPGGRWLYAVSAPWSGDVPKLHVLKA